MKIELNIDASNFSDSLGKVFDSLSEEDRKQIAKEVLTKFLTEDYEAERKARSQEIIRQLREKGDSTWQNNSDKYKNMSDKEIMDCYEFKQRTNNLVTSREQMIKSITETAMGHYKELVASLVKEDEQMKNVYEKVRETIEKSFPAYVHDAMVRAFTDHFKHSYEGYMRSYQNSTMFSNELKNLYQKLNIPVPNQYQ